MEQMPALPPKFLQPIYRTGKNTVIRRQVQTLPVKQYQEGEYPETGSGPYSLGGDAYTTGTESYSAGVDYSTGYGQY